MRNVLWVTAIAVALCWSGLHPAPLRAQTPPAKEATAAPESASKKAKAEQRKAKREDTKKARAEKKAKASAARAAVKDRQKQCGAEWREAKAAGKTEKGMTWPKFWSACNARLKAKSG
ncbi:hypothetical protein [Pseudorhodoplanes sp.]|uniref:hypothetical protein n=1 Tax=Pseudorhodoplanes sp. TaxID=1934341 RepID=UPI00391877C1